MVKLINISKSYDKKGRNWIFQNVNFEINDSEFVMLKGVSGAGKSTLLNIIGGIEPATGGNIVVNDIDVTALKGKARAKFYQQEIGFIFQGFYLQPQLTIGENIALVGTFAGMAKKDREVRTRELVKNLGIEGVLGMKPAEVSGGQAERACVARAMFMKPKIILADEPTNNLDPENAKNVIELLKWAQQELGAIVIVASHDDVVKQYATRVIEIRDGEVFA